MGRKPRNTERSPATLAANIRRDYYDHGLSRQQTHARYRHVAELDWIDDIIYYRIHRTADIFLEGERGVYHDDR